MLRGNPRQESWGETVAGILEGIPTGILGKSQQEFLEGIPTGNLGGNLAGIFKGILAGTLMEVLAGILVGPSYVGRNQFSVLQGKKTTFNNL